MSMAPDHVPARRMSARAKARILAASRRTDGARPRAPRGARERGPRRCSGRATSCAATTSSRPPASSRATSPCGPSNAVRSCAETTASRPPASSGVGRFVAKGLAAPTVTVDGVVGASRGYGEGDANGQGPSREALARIRRGSVVLGPRHVDVDLVRGLHLGFSRAAPGRWGPLRGLLRGRDRHVCSRGARYRFHGTCSA